jgi:hypothetical protein
MKKTTFPCKPVRTAAKDTEKKKKEKLRRQ